MKKIRGPLALLLAALVWGMAFVAQSTAADKIGSFTFNATRSVVAAIFLLGVIGIQSAIAQKSTTKGETVALQTTLLGGVACGVLLFISANFQQFGIAVYPEGVASSGRAGFLTATYVVMVALMALFSGKKLQISVLLATVGCIAGMYLLCLSDGFDGIYLGDILVLASALGFAFYLLVVDYFSKADSLKMSCIQFFVCGALSMLAMFIFEKPDFKVIYEAWMPILYAGIFSSGVGYTLQMYGQKYAEPAVASIVMSLESVFAALAGWVLLHEVLSGSELFGCVLVFVSVILAQIPDFLKGKPAQTNSVGQ